MENENDYMNNKLKKIGYVKCQTMNNALYKVGPENVKLPEMKRSEFLRGTWSAYSIKIVKADNFPAPEDMPKIRSGNDIYTLMQDIANLDRENLFCIYLTSEMRVAGIEIQSTGTTWYTIAAIHMILRGVLLSGQIHFCLCHNHSYGSLSYSQQDLDSYMKVYQAGKTMGLICHDSIIIGKNSWASVRAKLERDGHKFDTKVNWNELL